MAGLLHALLQNETGGRNVLQGNIGDINNQTGDLAKGYFQITDATWRDFGGLDTGYSRAIDAPYDVQAKVAANIPLKRWGPTTIAAMQATGKPIDTNRTLGENLAANNESFIDATPDTTTTTPSVLTGKKGEEIWTQPKRAARHPPNPQVGTGGYVAPGAPTMGTTPADALATAADIATLQETNPWSSLASGLASSVSTKGGLAGGVAETPMPAVPDFASAQAPVAQVAAPLGGEMVPQLSDLFQVDPRQFGQAAMLNVDAAGNPIRRRQYG